MASPAPKLPAAVLRSRRAVIEALQGMELLCSGSLFTRTKVCGKSYCRCAQDPQARHGPYLVWIHREGGRLIQRVISPLQAQVSHSADLADDSGKWRASFRQCVV